MSRTVYKYRANTATDDNKVRRDIKTLLSHQLYAASFDSLNDPFETSAELPPDDKPGNEWVIGIKQMAYSAGVYSLIKPLDNETFPCSELMWAHYADSHKGFCIEYDLDILCQHYGDGFNVISELNVQYQANRPDISPDGDIDDALHSIFGIKSKAWEYENEYRIVFGSAGLKPVPKNAVKAIYFGLRMDLNQRRQIINGLKDDNIKFYQIERIENTYQLKATRLMFEYDYTIVDEEHLALVDNYTILYKSTNKDKGSIIEFIQLFRKEKTKKTNITIIDDERVMDIIDRSRNTWSSTERDIITNHWIAFSSFEAPDSVWMYPEK